MKPMTVSHSHGFNCAIEDDFDGYDHTYGPIISSSNDDDLQRSFAEYLEESIIQAFEVGEDSTALRGSIKSFIDNIDIDVEFEPEVFEDSPGRANGTRRVTATFPDGLPFSDILSEHMESYPFEEADWPQSKVVFVDQEFNAAPSEDSPLELRMNDIVSDLVESYNELSDTLSYDQLLRVLAEEGEEALGVSGLEEKLRGVNAPGHQLNEDRFVEVLNQEIFSVSLQGNFPAPAQEPPKEKPEVALDTPSPSSPKI